MYYIEDMHFKKLSKNPPKRHLSVAFVTVYSAKSRDRFLKKFWEQVFLGFHGKNHLFQRKSGYLHFALEYSLYVT